MPKGLKPQQNGKRTRRLGTPLRLWPGAGASEGASVGPLCPPPLGPGPAPAGAGRVLKAASYGARTGRTARGGGGGMALLAPTEGTEGRFPLVTRPQRMYENG